MAGEDRQRGHGSSDQAARVKRAAVDVGTNSVRLLVVDEAGERVQRDMTITRLGRGVDDRGHLDDEALAKTLDTIERYRDTWSEHGVDADHVRIAATSAVRDASDRDRFFDGVRELTGVAVEVLSGDEEARTSFLGASGAVDAPRPVAVVDIGGGSTEIVVGDADDQVRGGISLQLGCVRLTERLLAADPPTAGQLDAARAEVQRQLDRADEELAERGARVAHVATMIGVAGTVTTLAAIDLGLDSYQAEAIHGHRLPRTAVDRLAQRLAQIPAAQRREYGPMAPGREDVILGGALILQGLLERYDLDGLVASESDILDGLALTAGRS